MLKTILNGTGFTCISVLQQQGRLEDMEEAYSFLQKKVKDSDETVTTMRQMIEMEQKKSKFACKSGNLSQMFQCLQTWLLIIQAFF